MKTKYRLTPEGAKRLDIRMRHQAGLLGFDASEISASQVAVECGLLEIVDTQGVQ